MNAEAGAFVDTMNRAHARGEIELSVDDVLASSPRGLPRPLTGRLPTPWISRVGELGDVDVYRRGCAVMMRLCAVCGEPLGLFARVYWRPGDRIVIDGIAVHPEPCGSTTERLCPALVAFRRAGTLRVATVATEILVAEDAGEHATEEGMPRGYGVPIPQQGANR